MRVAGCPLCEAPGGRVVFQGPAFRVIHAQEDGFPGFYRLVWEAHAAEFSDLAADERALCMEAVATVEQALRTHLRPAKVNLAALGNLVPHLHWHVIARFDWDSRFPAPVWAPPQREAPAGRLSGIQALLPTLEKDMIVKLGRAA